MASRDLLYGLLAASKGIEGGIDSYAKLRQLRSRLAEDQSQIDYRKKELENKQTVFGNKTKEMNLESIYKSGLTSDELTTPQGRSEYKKLLHSKSTKEHQNFELDDLNNSIKPLEGILANGMKLSESQQAIYEALLEKRNKIQLPGFDPNSNRPLSVTTPDKPKEKSYFDTIGDVAAKATNAFLKPSTDLGSLLKAERVRRQNAQGQKIEGKATEQSIPKDTGIFSYGDMSHDGKLREPKKRNTFGY